MSALRSKIKTDLESSIHNSSGYDCRLQGVGEMSYPEHIPEDSQGRVLKYGCPVISVSYGK